MQQKHKDAKQYWKLLKESQGITAPKSLTSKHFLEYFKSVNNPDDPFYQADEDILEFNERVLCNENETMFEELDLSITDAEIRRGIKELKTGKSGGPDKIINEFFIHGASILLPYLNKLFNLVFNQGYFPVCWSEGYIVPIYKKGSLNNVENYRGITLLSVLGKLFTRVLNNRLTEWAENYYVYIEAQAGFRSHMGTVDNIFVLHGLITHLINEGRKLYCGFIDFTKAFDFVSRDVIWYKLIKLGVKGKMLNIVKSIYQQVKSKVKYNNSLSETFDCYLGVRQGECLSPFLFSIYINDIEGELINENAKGVDIGLIKLFLLLYADDITLFSDSADGLQEGFNILSEYCDRWKLKVNLSKTKVMIFRKGGRLPNDIAFRYKGTEIEIVQQFSYLGVVFTSGGSFSNAQATLAGQAQKAIFKLKGYLERFTMLTPKHVLELFDKLVSPVLNYGSEVWGFCKAKQIERVHLQFCKGLLWVKQSTQNNFIYGELGRVSFDVKRHYNIVRYWLKVIKSSDIKYIKIIYNLMLQDTENNPGKINWAVLVKNLLGSLGFNDVWIQQGVGDEKLFMLVLKQRLNDNFMQTWNAELNQSTRALFYRSISNFKYQDYLDVVTVKKFRNALARLRVSSHRLEVEVGRWNRQSVEYAERKCRICNKLEDEYHFIFECAIYEDLRRDYIPRYYRIRPNMFKCIELLNTSNQKHINKLAAYVYKAFEARNAAFFSG